MHARLFRNSKKKISSRCNSRVCVAYEIQGVVRMRARRSGGRGGHEGLSDKRVAQRDRLHVPVQAPVMKSDEPVPCWIQGEMMLSGWSQLCAVSTLHSAMTHASTWEDSGQTCGDMREWAMCPLVVESHPLGDLSG
jgi:hypothetical protein